MMEAGATIGTKFVKLKHQTMSTMREKSFYKNVTHFSWVVKKNAVIEFSSYISYVPS